MNLTYCDPPTYVRNIVNHELFLIAYKKWTSVSSVCKCGHGVHGSALAPLESSPISEACERQKAWHVYVKVRENMALSNDEKLYLGFM